MQSFCKRCELSTPLSIHMAVVFVEFARARLDVWMPYGAFIGGVSTFKQKHDQHVKFHMWNFTCETHDLHDHMCFTCEKHICFWNFTCETHVLYL